METCRKTWLILLIPVSGELLATVEFGFRPADFVISPDGRQVDVLVSNSIVTVSIDGDQISAGKSHWGTIGTHGRIARQEDGEFYAIASRNADVTVWNPATRRKHQSYLGTSDFRAIAFKQRGVFAAADGDHGLVFLDMFALEGFGARQDYEIEGVAPGLGTWELAFSHDRKILATSHIDGNVTLWKLPGEPLTAVQADRFQRPESVFALAFSPGDELLFVSCQDGNVYVRDLRERKWAKALQGGVGSLVTLDLNDRGDILAAGSLGGDIVIWWPGK